MLVNLYSVYDEKAEAFLPSFEMLNDAMAVRGFIECFREGKHDFSRNPADYTLWRLAILRQATGEIEQSLKQLLPGLEARRIGNIKDGEADVMQEQLELQSFNAARANGDSINA